MSTDVTMLMFLLIIIVSLTMTRPKNYPILVLVGLIAAALYNNKSEEFADKVDKVDEVIVDLPNQGVPAADKNKWDNADAVNQMFTREPEATDGDQRLFDHSKHVGMQAQEAILNRSRFTSDNFRPLVQQELDEASKSSGWWEDDNLEAGFVKDGVDYSKMD